MKLYKTNERNKETGDILFKKFHLESFLFPKLIIYSKNLTYLRNILSYIYIIRILFVWLI